MKILAVITGMTNGGAERVMATLCNEFSNKNEVRLCILKSSISDYAISKNVKVVSGNIKNKNLFKSIFFVKKQLEEYKPDIVLSFMTKSNIISIIANRLSKYKCPIVISERANPYHTKGVLGKTRDYLYRYADGCVFQTKDAQDYYKNILKCSNEIIVNPLAKDFNVKPYRGKRVKKIVCTARLSREKNQQLLINAFAKIKDAYPEYRLEIYGEGPEKDNLQLLIDTLRIGDRAKLMGRKKNIIECIQSASVFVLPSNSEGMPNALLEAMALGIPSISTDCPIGGPADIIKNNDNGMLIPMDDEKALIKAIEKIITNPEFAHKIGENGTKVISNFDTYKVCNKWEKYLKKVKEGYKK